MTFKNNIRYRGIFMAFLCLFWVIFFLTLPVSAETVAKVAETEGQEYTPTNKNSDTAELFDEYVEAATDKSGVKSRIKKAAGNKLSGINKTIYTRLMGDIAQVAAGEKSSTIFKINVEDLGLEQLTWTASELGVESIIIDGNLTEEASSALLEKGEYDLKAIINALLADNPYELYWYDKTSQTESQGYTVNIFYDYDKKEYCISFTGSIAFSFPVAEEYSAGKYTFDTEIGKSVQTIVTKANAIVEKYANDSDYEKLDGYREEICALVSYNHNAASGSVSYGNPWQLIWVFDGNPETNVVCEGYAKAFQYLCNLTEFNDEIDCITVTGTMSGSTGDDPHMWNVVTMEDGNNYLVDITNCDEGTVGADHLLFLAGKNSGELDTGYIFYCNNKQIKYSYDDKTMDMFSNEELIITSLSYNGSGVYTSGYYNYILQNGKAVITKYSGDETEVIVPAEIDGYSVDKLGNGVFWNNSSVQSIIISEGIREFTRGLVGYGVEEIRANAATIDGCSSLQKIVLPSTLSMSCSDLDTGKVLGNYIERIGPKYSNSNLDIIVSPHNPYLKVVDGILYNYDMDTLILAPHNTTQSEYTIPDGVKYIYDLAMSGNEDMVKLNLPDSIEVIGFHAFGLCTNLVEVNIPKQCRIIKQSAFASTAIEKIAFNDNLQSIGQEAFWGCSNLTELFLPEHLVDIGARAFMTGSIINGYPNSLAETYAKDNGFIFVDRTQTSSNEESGTIVQPEQGETVQKPGNISTLKPEDIKINSIGVSGLSHNIAAGKKIQLSVTVFPENASNKIVQWSSSNPDVATVTPSGFVTVKKKTGGKSVVIRATAMDGSGKTGLWKITSMKGTVKSVVISGKKSVKAGGALKLKANVKSTKGAYKKINWSSSNTKWATVTSSGKVKTSKAAKGKAVKITAMAMDGSKKKNTVTIKIK